jgi:hypothetical protein
MLRSNAANVTGSAMDLNSVGSNYNRISHGGDYGWGMGAWLFGDEY